jgi:hypothetical protein
MNRFATVDTGKKSVRSSADGIESNARGNQDEKKSIRDTNLVTNYYLDHCPFIWLFLFVFTKL